MIFSKLSWLVFALTLLLAADAWGQKILLLEKTKKFKRIRHFTGDHLAFRLVDEKFTIAGEIEAIFDDGILVNDELYPIGRISLVLNYQKFAVFRRLSKYAFYAIPPMLVYTMLHRGLNTGEHPLLDRNSLQVVGVFAAVGVLLWPLKARKYRMGNRWQLRVLDITPG